MATPIFNRKYHLFFSIPLIPYVSYDGGWSPTIGTFTVDDVVKYEEVIKKEDPDSGPVSYITQGETYGFSDLNISFKIKKTTAANSNSCDLSIYNADEDLLNRLDAYQGKGAACEFRVGDSKDTGSTALIFQGTVETVVSKQKGSDVITKIKMSDSGKNLKETYTKRSYEMGTSVDVVMADLVSDLGLPVGFIQKATGKKTGGPAILESATSYSGQAYKALQRVCTTYRMGFSVQNGMVYICDMAKRVPLYGNTPILSSISGVVDELRVKDASAALTNDSETNRARYSIKTLMYPSIVPHTSVLVIDDEGVYIPYKVESVVHEGEYEGTKWYSIFELSVAEVAV